MKTCCRCKNNKNLDEFCNNKNYSDGKNGTCKECKKQSDKKFFEKNKERLIKVNSNWSKNNRERRKILDKNWRENNKEKIININKKYRYNNPHYKIRNIWNNLKNKDYILDVKQKNYYNTIKIHIESQFNLDMNWGNIEIDHKVPISWFIDKTPISIINNLENLQPLLIETNRIKSNKYSDIISKDYYNLIIHYIKSEYQTQLNLI